jgi:hypothetical protein
MLVNFLEIGIATADIAAAFDGLCSLGFRAIPVGDVHTHPYAVVADGTVYIGLHTRELTSPWLAFVRPGLKDHVRVLRRHAIPLEFAHLADDQFHEVGFRDPSNQLVVLCEARTFSPPAAADDLAASICGAFLEYSVSTGSLEDSCAFWHALDFTTIAEGTRPHPWARLAGGGLTLGLHQCALFPPGLSFTATQLPARIEYLRAKGHHARPRAPIATAADASATLLASRDLPINLTEPKSGPA